MPAEGTKRVGIYAQRSVLDAARAAYVRDVVAGGAEAESFAEWVDGAVAAFVATSTEPRLDGLAGAQRVGSGGSGRRDMALTVATWDALTRAMHDDAAAGHPYSQSVYVRAAMIEATERVRRANGGTLPPAPRRLPPRLVRPLPPRTVGRPSRAGEN